MTDIHDWTYECDSCGEKYKIVHLYRGPIGFENGYGYCPACGKHDVR